MSPGAIEANLAAVLERVESSASRASRDPGSIRLVGVTKTVPPEPILAAVRAGLRDIGENRVQEAAGKWEALARAEPSRPAWHLVGHLQSNKTRRAAEMFDWIHSIDRDDLARRLDRHAGEAGRKINVLIQVDLGHEPSKHGIEEDGVEPLARALTELPHLLLQGLMTLPPLFVDPEGARPYFARLRRLRDDLANRGFAVPHLSMGMTGDFEVAIEEGATIVRVGRALFGERPIG